MSNTTNIDKIIKALEELTVLEALKLVKDCEEKWGVSSAGAANTIASVATEEVKEERTEFSVELISAGDKKIQVMKSVRGIIEGMDLASAKKFVEDASEKTPSSLGTNFSKAKAEETVKILKEAGAEAIIK